MFHHNYHSVEFLVSIIIPFRIPQPCTQWKNSWSSKDIWNVLLNKKSDVHNWKKKRWGFICSGKHIFFFLKIGVIFTLKKKQHFLYQYMIKMIWKGLTDVVFLHNACVTIYGRISKNYNHNHISAVQLYYVCWMTFHSILLAMDKHCRNSGTPCLTGYVENPQLISDIAITCFNFASIHVDVFL